MIYTEMTITAMKIAYDAHSGQLDYNDVPYIFHPYHLAEQMDDEISCTVAQLRYWKEKYAKAKEILLQ